MTIDLVELFRGLVRLETELWNRLDLVLQQAHGLSLSWLEVMQVVDGTEGCRVLDIAHALSITVGGASKVVDKVEAAGFCRREPHPRDARSNVIQLTGPGSTVLAAANRTFESALASLFRVTTSEDELVHLADTVHRLREHLLVGAAAS